MTLREHLDAVAKATGLRVGATAASFANVPELRAFRTELAEDPDLRRRAETMLLSIEDRVAQRDHISRWNKAALESALSAEGAQRPGEMS
jgi:hypothetical protein